MTAPTPPSPTSPSGSSSARSRAPRHLSRPAWRSGTRRGAAAGALSCGNLAHAFAACAAGDKAALAARAAPNLGIVTAYNDMLSAHQPYETYPAADQAGGPRGRRHRPGRRRRAGDVRRRHPGPAGHGAVAVLPRRDRHGDGDRACRTTCSTPRSILGVCDKIVPGLVIGALTFGHLPAVFLPGGPMTSGIPNDQKAKVRQQFANGKVGRDELMEAEMAILPRPRHLHLLRHRQLQPDADGDHGPAPAGRAASSIPDTPLRDALTVEGAKRALAITALGNAYTPVGDVIDERAFVNGIVGLHATGGSTNHTIHLIAMARGGRHQLDWEDFAELSDVDAAAGPRLSERARRREPFPRRRRHGVPDRRAARRGPAARRRAHRLAARACDATRRSRSSSTAALIWAQPAPQRAANDRVLRADRQAVPADRRR